jgi:multiple sugar transport system substrate-binding protein
MSRTTNRRTFLKIAGLTGVGAVLAACGQPAATSAPAATAAPQATTAPAAAPTTAPAAGAATIEFWTFNDYATGVPLQLFNGFISDFQTANPGIKVNITGKPGSDILAGLVAGAGSGDLPDAIQIQLGVGGDLIAINALQDMEPYWATMTADYQGQFNKGAIGPCIQNGKVYGLPFSAYAAILFRNLTVLKKAGIDTTTPPKDWADFASQLDTITKAGLKGTGKILGSDWTQMHFYGGIPGTAKSVIAPDGKSTMLQAPAYQALFEYLLKIKQYSVASNEADTATSDLFSTNQLAYVTMGPWLAPTLDAVNGKNGFAYDVVEIPGQTADSKGSIRGGEFTGMTSLKQKDQSWKFIQFISDYPQEAKWAATIGRLMANDKALQQPDAMKNALVQVTGKAFNNAVDEALFMQKTATGWGQPEIDFGTQVDTGKVAPADAAPQMIAAINKILAGG